MFLLAFYVTFALITAAVGAFIFLRLKSRGAGRAVAASGIGVAFLLLFFPIPVHGGFTFPVEIMLAELRSLRARAEQTENHGRKEAFRKRLAARFGGPLALAVQEQVKEPLSAFSTAGGVQGFYDARSGLAWTDLLALEGAGTPPDLERARAFCADIEPKGFWALPTEAELSLFWKAGGYVLSPLGGYGTAGLLENVDFQTEMLSVRSSRNGTYALRCVAIGPAGPAGGYLSGDIPLEDWNAYQLQKTMPGFGGPG